MEPNTTRQSSAITSAVEKLDELNLGEEDSDEEAEILAEAQGTASTAGPSGKKKKRRRKPKTKSKPEVATGCIPNETPAPSPETPEESEYWESILPKGVQTFPVPPFGLLDLSFRPWLNIFSTPSCESLELRTKRLSLRMVQIGDTPGIKRIKTEPVVQKTQLYGSPDASHIKSVFQNRYIRSRMPRACAKPIQTHRDEYVFAITVSDPSISIKPLSTIRSTNRLPSTDGYLGNIAFELTNEAPFSPKRIFFPKKGVILTYPTVAQWKEAKMVGALYYEIHPQLWGQGIMSEAFAEVLRFAFEEVGLWTMSADPTDVNPGSIRVCTKNGLKYIETVMNNAYGKPQMVHRITRDEWYALNRPGQEAKDVNGGKEICRWCMNFRLAPPTIRCRSCEWARYCSRECQWADWRFQGGHQDECNMK